MSKKSLRRGARVVRHTLADGSIKEYKYPAYKRVRVVKRGDTLGDLIAAWQSSPEWRALQPSTQAGYATYGRHLLGMERVAAARVGRRELIEIRNAVAHARGNGAATGFTRAASAVFGWAVENGWIEHSPMTKVKRLKGGELPAWSDDEVDAALSTFPEHLRRAVVLALYTGQRRIDLIRMSWGAYDGRSIRLTQQKTGAALVIPVHPVLKTEIDAWRAETSSTLILVNKFGRPWMASNLSKQIGEAMAKLGGKPRRNIHGLRKLAAARLAEAGCTLNQIAAITGHRSLGMLRLYTASADQERLAEDAIVRLVEAHGKNAEKKRNLVD